MYFFIHFAMKKLLTIQYKNKFNAVTDYSALGNKFNNNWESIMSLNPFRIITGIACKINLKKFISF